MAGEEIEVLPGVEIDPDVVLQIGLDFEPECGKPIKPVTQIALRRFCDDDKSYKANIVATSYTPEKDEENKVEIEDDTQNQLNAYPNPSNKEVTMVYQLAQKETVSLYISNMLGEQVISILANETQEAGTHSLPVDLSQLEAGMYIYTLQTSEGILSKRLAIVR